MIKAFSVRNYRSFKETTILSLDAVEQFTELEHHIIDTKTCDLVKIASIYGPNGGGKSNYIRAIYLLTKLILHSINKDDIRFLRPFSFVEKPEKKLSFQIDLIEEKTYFMYHLKIENDEHQIKIVSEELSYLDQNQKSQVIYQDKKYYDETQIGKTPLSSNLDKLRNIFISGIKKILLFKHNDLADVFDYDRIIEFISKDKRKQNLLKLLKEYDSGIIDIVSISHQIMLKYNVAQKDYYLDLHEESTGTWRLINLLSFVMDIIDQKGVLLIDELDSHLHPLVVRTLITLFGSKTNDYSQLIFSSHDVLNMSGNYLRRDEIFFIKKNENQESELFSLSDVVNYKGENISINSKYGRQYMLGRFGAIPKIKSEDDK